jgi:homoserine dehydrogenase
MWACINACIASYCLEASCALAAAAAAGADVARKVVILARECGLQLGLSDLQVSSLVPAALQGVSVADFMQQLPQVGAAMTQAHAVPQGATTMLRVRTMIQNAHNCRQLKHPA